MRPLVPEAHGGLDRHRERPDHPDPAIGPGEKPALRRHLASPPDRVRSFVRANLPLLPAPAVPEILLHQARPTSGLMRLAERDPLGFGQPYWAYAWGGGLALARHVLDRSALVAGLRVLDLGAGSGLVGIAAAKAGAATVAAADVDPYAVAALGLNAEANGVPIVVIDIDLAAPPPPAIDLVLVGDLFYEADLARRVETFLDGCVSAGIQALVGDPGRAFLPRHRLRHLADCRVPDVGTAPGAACGAVYAFEPVPLSAIRHAG